jgi:N-acetylmuramoyl-L-alanine amidase
MAVDYTVQRGDCISSIAHEFGQTWKRLWDHPSNADLKKKRVDPNILKEGDVVHVPDPELKECEVPSGAVHRFVVKLATAKLRIRLVLEPAPKSKAQAPAAPSADSKSAITEDPEPDTTPLKDEPRAGVAYTVEIGKLSIQGKTGSDGMLECDIPPNAREGRLILEPGTPNETILPLNLGHLDPLDEISGVKQRLANLTFPCGEGNDATPELSAALRGFQQKHGLSVTGELDQETKDALASAHDRA